MAAALQRALDLKEATLAASANYYIRQLSPGASAIDVTDGGPRKKYIVSLTVSELAAAGTVANVTLVINGTKASTKPFTVSQTFAQTLLPGATTTQLFELPDLGDLLTIDIELIAIELTDALHLRYVVVVDTTTKGITVFPCYRWIESKLTIRNGNASLAFKETNPLLLAQRLNELRNRQDKFKWGSNPRYAGWPGYTGEGIFDAPADVQFNDAENASFQTSVVEAGKKFKLKVLSSSPDRYPDFKGFLDAAKAMGNQGDDDKVMLHVFNTWTLDEEFGRQFLNGINPVMLQKCTALPANFPAEEELKLIGLTVQSGDLYIANYADINGVLKPGQGNPGAYYCAPICLFRKLPDGKLLPIVIQLNQTPGADNPLWTPKDGLGWLLAKMYVKNADGIIHQAVTHLLKTHLVLEAVTVALWRQLPEAHPVFKLLVPHTRSTIAINCAARSTLINDGGIFDKTVGIGIQGAAELVRRAFKRFKIQDLNFPEAILKRRVDGNIPNFHFRDDGILLFNTIREYVTEVLNIYYLGDGDVKNDTELQAWMQDIYTNGFASTTSDGTHHGFTGSIASKAELITLVTSVIYQASVGHASINFSQLAYYGFVPNAPLMMRAPPPTSKSGITIETVMLSLGTTSDVGNQLTITYTLSRYADGEVFLGVFPELHFTEAAANAAAKKFKANLDMLNAKFSARNASPGAISYPYMLPSLVPNSIAK